MCITLLCNAIDSAVIAEHDVLDSLFCANVLELLHGLLDAKFAAC